MFSGIQDISEIAPIKKKSLSKILAAINEDLKSYHDDINDFLNATQQKKFNEAKATLNYFNWIMRKGELHNTHSPLSSLQSFVSFTTNLCDTIIAFKPPTDLVTKQKQLIDKLKQLKQLMSANGAKAITKPTMQSNITSFTYPIQLPPELWMLIFSKLDRDVPSLLSASRVGRELFPCAVDTLGYLSLRKTTSVYSWEY